MKVLICVGWLGLVSTATGSDMPLLHRKFESLKSTLVIRIWCLRAKDKTVVAQHKMDKVIQVSE